MELEVKRMPPWVRRCLVHVIEQAEYEVALAILWGWHTVRDEVDESETIIGHRQALADAWDKADEYRQLIARPKSDPPGESVARYQRRWAREYRDQMESCYQIGQSMIETLSGEEEAG